MALSVGIVGFPNVGKSTLFKALTRKNVEAANYPFATIDPNVGIVQIQDERLDKLEELFNSKKKVPAIVEFVDIAGLVEGAHKGQGLGNKFLAAIREVDLICHVVRCFESDDIIHAKNRVNPLEDIEIIHTELLLKDMETVSKRLWSVSREAKANKKEAVQEHDALQGLEGYISSGKWARRYFDDNPKHEEALRDLHLLTAKKHLYALNSSTGKVPEDVLEYIRKEGSSYVILDAEKESEFAGMTEEDIEELGAEPSKIQDLVRESYDLLGLRTFFTVSEKEAHAWQFPEGATAPEAAGIIHSDFQQKFIRAVVIGADELLEIGGLSDAAAQGRVRTEGKEYVVQDGDVIEFRHGA